MKMKKIWMCLVIGTLLATMSACASTPKDSDVDFEVATVVDSIKEAVEMGMAFPADDEYLKSTYSMDMEKVNEYTYLMGANIDANRIAVFELKDAKDAEEFKKIVEQMQTDLQKSFEQYLPGPYEVSKNSKIVVKGKYVAFFSAEKVDEAVKIFEEQFAAKK